MVKSFEVDNPVLTALHGLVATYPHLTLVESDKVVFRVPEGAKDKVALISGGGAGHEPTHAGFVGTGCLTGAVSGEIFASPSTKQIINGIKILAKNSEQGVLLIVKNYTGDVLHFGLAGERARALGIDTEVVVIGDDVAVGRSKGGLVGRRAIAGTLFVHKIVGAYIEYEKHTLKQAADLARTINDNLVTIGSSLDHAKVPGHAFESKLTEQQMELGMGIHNEPGVKILSPVPSVSDLIKDHILPKLLDQSDKDRAFVPFNKGDKVVLLINNLGGVSNLILSAITQTAISLLKSEYDIVPVRTYTGTVMTALNGEGFSVSLLNASRADSALKGYSFNSIVDLLDAPTDAPGWPVKKWSGDKAASYDPSLLEEGGESVTAAGKFDPAYFKKFLEAGVNKLVAAEPHITELDTLVGDGDCGTTLVSGGEGLVKNFGSIPTSSLSEALHKISDLVETYMGGTSGGLYSIFITGLCDGVISAGADTEIDQAALSKALVNALEVLYKYTNARPGDSTVIDALEPFVKEFASSQDFSKAVKAADEGAQSTGKLDAKFGRASYVGESSSVADPGAIGLVEFLKGVQSAL